MLDNKHNIHVHSCVGVTKLHAFACRPKFVASPPTLGRCDHDHTTQTTRTYTIHTP